MTSALIRTSLSKSREFKVLINFTSIYSDLQSESTSKIAETGTNNRQMLEGGGKQLTCCAECSSKFEAEARSLQSSSSCNSESTTSSLPAWLQQYKNENKVPSGTNDQVLIITLSAPNKLHNYLCIYGPALIDVLQN